MVALRVAAAVLLGLVGLIALSMAWKGLSAGRLLPFHQAGTGRTWDELSPRVRSVASALTRSLGLGFLAAGVSLLTAAVTAAVGQSVATFTLAAAGLVFCAGLAMINRRLTMDTSVATPWKQSLYAVAVIVTALALYAIG
jgi:hypothetical protein